MDVPNAEFAFGMACPSNPGNGRPKWGIRVWDGPIHPILGMGSQRPSNPGMDSRSSNFGKNAIK